MVFLQNVFLTPVEIPKPFFIIHDRNKLFIYSLPSFYADFFLTGSTTHERFQKNYGPKSKILKNVQKII